MQNLQGENQQKIIQGGICDIEGAKAVAKKLLEQYGSNG